MVAEGYGWGVSAIGSWWLAKHEAREAESVVWSIKANRTQGKRAVGGKLFITTERVLFSPHLVDAALGGKRAAIELSSLIAVERQPKGGDRLAGGLRDRLRLVIDGAPDELFVVNQLDVAIQRLREDLRPAGEREALEAWRLKDLLICRVCGLKYDAPPWGPQLVYEFCDCCGVQFSYEDASPGSARSRRQEWLEGGAEWFKPEKRPAGWTAKAQLAQLPAELR
jgi:hypothetical protein